MWSDHDAEQCRLVVGTWKSKNSSVCIYEPIRAPLNRTRDELVISAVNVFVFLCHDAGSKREMVTCQEFGFVPEIFTALLCPLAHVDYERI